MAGRGWTAPTGPASGLATIWGRAVPTAHAYFGFDSVGTSNLIVVVEPTTNWAEGFWTPPGTNMLTGGASYFSDPQWTNDPSRLYRLRSP